MDSGQALVADVVAWLGGQPHRLLAIELQWGASSFDKIAGRWRFSLDLCGIVAAPGWQDSRYRSVVVAKVPVNDQAERDHAAVLAEAVAARLGVPCRTPDLGPDGEESGQTGRSHWMAAQGPAPMAPFPVQWEAEYWSEDGITQTAAGTEVAVGSCGADAQVTAMRALESRLGSDYAPVHLRCSIPALHQNTGRPDPSPNWTTSVPRRRLGLRVEDVRDLRRANETPAQIVRWLLHRVRRTATDSPTHRAEPATMAVIWAMHEAFELSLDKVAEIGPWRAGTLSDADLDAAIGPRLDATKPCWNLPHTIRHAHRSGRDVVAVLRAALHEHGKIFLIRYLLEACEHKIRLRAATEIVEAVRDNDDRAALVLLGAVLKSDSDGGA